MKKTELYTRKKKPNKTKSLEQQKNELQYRLDIEADFKSNISSFEKLQNKIDNNEVEKVFFKTQI